MISKLTTFSLYITQEKQMICCRVYIQYYKMFREMCMLRLVRMSSLYFHKAHALRHMNALQRYNACSLRHQYTCTQFTIHFIIEITKLVPQALLSYISTWEFLRTLEKCEKHSPLARFYFFNRSPKTSKCGRNISDTLDVGCALSGCFFLLPCGFLLYEGPTNMMPLNYNQLFKYFQASHLNICFLVKKPIWNLPVNS